MTRVCKCCRGCGGVRVLLDALSPRSPVSPASRSCLLSVANVLVTSGDEEGPGAGALVQGGLVEALLGLMGPTPLPRTQVGRGGCTGKWGSVLWVHCVWLWLWLRLQLRLRLRLRLDRSQAFTTCLV